MTIQVNDFRWEPGKNDAEYIKLLELSRNEWQKIAQKAIAKLKAQEPVEPMHLHDESKLPLKCGNCGAFIIVIGKPFGIGSYRAKFCCECGQAVKWE